MKELRIVYMGTPEFAVPSLETLVDNGYNVVGVITAPDKPAGRGRQLKSSPVKDYAASQNLKILQPANLKSPEFLEELKSLNANLQIVVAFRMLPEVVWNMPELGTFNLHASKLPNYRGAAPINWAIINGDNYTGCTTFFLKHEIDTGDIILQHEEPIHPEDNVGTLYTRLMNKGADLVLETVRLIENDRYELKKQVLSDDMKAAPKIFKETCQINWSKPCVEIHNFVRGLSPYPAAWTYLNDLSCKVYKTSILDQEPWAEDKTYRTDNKTFLHFKTADGVISIEELQLQGKKRMDIESFLRGYKL